MAKYKDKLETNNEKLQQLTDIVRNKRGGYSITQNTDGDNCSLYIKDSGATNPTLNGLIDGTLTDLVIPDGVTTIRDYAFQHQVNLINIKIPETVTIIQNYCFVDCKSLRKLIFPKSIKRLGGEGLFNTCSSLESVENYPKTNNTWVGNNCFSDCWALKNIELPDNITSIYSNAFYRCKSLEAFNFKNINFIGWNSFYGCTNIWEAWFDTYEGIYLQSYAFANCDSLVHLVCSNTTSIPTIETNTFPTTQQILVEVPESLLESWKTATNWSAYSNLIFKAYPYTIPTTTYNFVTDGGTAVDSITTSDWIKTAPVTTPNDTSKYFAGWYLDSNFTNKVSFPYNNFEGGSITLYAKYSERDK